MLYVCYHIHLLNQSIFLMLIYVKIISSYFSVHFSYNSYIYLSHIMNISTYLYILSYESISISKSVLYLCILYEYRYIICYLTIYKDII